MIDSLKKFSPYLLSLALISSGAVVSAQDAEDEAASSDDENKITVTGSRIKRNDYEGAQPVIVISSDEMEAKGATTVFEALRDLTQNTGFQFEGPESALFTPDVQTFNLRGTGVGNTLILINGRRITNYPAAYQASSSVVNFGAIPAAAVDQIEVLATGASAIYGSDAIAGVVNIKLKRDMEDNVINLLIGGPTGADSNPQDMRVQYVTGFNFDNGNITTAFEYQKRDPILSGDYDKFDSDLDYPYGQGILRRNNAVFDTWNINGWALDATDQGYRPPPNGAATCDALGNGTEYSERANRGFYCGRDGAAYSNLRNKSERYSVFVSGSYQLQDDVELFADVLYYANESESQSDYLYLGEDIVDFTTGRSTVFGLFPDWYTSQRYFTEQELGRSLDQTFEDTSLNISVGARGTWGEQDWELSVTQSDYELNTAQPWWKAEKVIETFLGDYQGTGFFGDNWWTGNGTFGFNDAAVYSPIDAALVNDAIGLQKYGNETSSTSLQFVMNGSLMDMDNGDLGYAMVFEYEKQDFSFIPDARIQQDPIEDYLVGSGWWNLTGYQGTGDRERYALGGELAIPLLETLTINMAARVDSYDKTSSSIGTRTTPSISLEWRPHDDFLVRAGYTESFRAPDLNYVYTKTGFFTGTTDYVQCLQSWIATGGTQANFDIADCTSSSSFVRRTPGTELSNTEEALKDETGDTLWLGFAWDITDDLQITIDYSEMSLEDRVRTESISGLLQDEYECYINSGLVGQDRCDYISSRILRVTDPTTGVSFVDEFNASPINAALQELSSIDARLFYNLDTDIGDFGLTVDYTHMLTNDYQNEPGDEIIDLRDDPISGGWDFRSIVSASLNYQYKDFSTTLTGIRRGSTTRYRAPAANGDWRVDPYVTYNLTASYQVTEDFTIAARVLNLTDEGAPEDDSHLFYDYPWYNIYVYSGSAIGRQVYLEATYTF